MSNKITGLLAPASALICLAWLSTPVSAQQIVLPPLPGETALQQAVGNAVATMCVNALDRQGKQTPQLLSVQQVDLHDQCHAIAVADIAASGGVVSPTNGAPLGGTGALGALQQVSGNEISAQGALATRVVAGQYANLSGRLNALRFGANAALSQGRVAATGSDTPGSGALASAGPRSFYLDLSMLDSGSQGDGFATNLALPTQSSQTGALTNTAFVTGGPVRFAQAEGAGGATAGGHDASPMRVTNPWGVFVQGSYNSGRHDATSNEDPFDFHAASVTAGIDYNFGMAVLGASVGYDNYDAGFGNLGSLVSGGSARVEGTSGSVYGAWFGEHWTFNGIATYGHLSTTLSRVVRYTVTFPVGVDPQPDLPPAKDNCGPTTCTVTTDRTLLGSPSGHTVAVGATAGYQYSAYAWELMPSLSFNYRRASFGSFVETDSNPPVGVVDGLPLAFGDQSVESLRSILGLELSRPVSTPFGVLTPVARVEWDHEFKTSARTIDAHYAFDPTAGTTCLSCFGLPTYASPPNYGIAGAGVSVTLAHRIQAFVYDEVLFGFANYHSNSVAFGVRGQF